MTLRLIVAALAALVLLAAACEDAADEADEPDDEVAEPDEDDEEDPDDELDEDDEDEDEDEDDEPEDAEDDDEPEDAEDDDEPEAEDEPEDAEDYDVDDQPMDAAATFVEPEAGATVESPVAVELEAEGVELVPAGEPAVGEGHLHVMVDVDCVDDGEHVPEEPDEGYVHFGDGQTSDEIELEPGTYELCVQLGDGVHAAFGATNTIEVTVE